MQFSAFIFILYFLAIIRRWDSGESNHGNSSFFGKLLTAAEDHPVIAGTLLVGASLSGVVAYKMHQTSKAKSLT